MNTRDDVEKFMIAADQKVSKEVALGFDGQSALYFDLIKEEFYELTAAYRTFDTVECADACADLIWVIEGFCHSLGIPLQQVWDEVARSNHSKISDSGKVVKRNDGKVLKPDTYSPPDIKSILSQGTTNDQLPFSFNTDSD
jgi:NTP pyrophosphatase (non-canonical NTP hydrolase)